MPTKPIDIKLKKGGIPSQSTSTLNTPTHQAHNPPVSLHPSVGLGDAERRRKKCSARSLLSLSIVAYLGYNFFYACGSPFELSADKPAICQSIDTIKLDIYAAYQSDFYKANLDPYIVPVAVRANEMYQTYGAPAQTKLVSLYQHHGKPVVDNGYLQAKRVYSTKILPAATPYLNNAIGNLRNVKGNYYLLKAKLAPYCDQATAEVNKAQAFIKYQYEQLPPPVIQAKDKAQATVLYWIDRAENTELVPVLVKYYRILLELYYYHFVPLSEHVTQHAKQQYDAHLKEYVDEHVKPLLIKYNERAHLNQLLDRARALLNQGELSHSASRGETVASTIAEIKTPTTTPKTLEDVPITTGTIAKTVVAPPHKETHINIVDKAKEAAAAARDKMKEGILADKVKKATNKIKEAAAASVLVKKAGDAASAAAVVGDKVKEIDIASNIVDKVEYVAAESVDMVKEAASEAYASYVTPVIVTEKETPTIASTTTANAEATIGYTVSNKDEYIVHKPSTASVPPLATPEFEDVPIPPPDANKKEAIYCPTCNAQEEQLIVAPTDKHVAAISEEPKEVFEVHKQQVVATPPQSPNNADYLKKDVQAIADEKELFEVRKEPIIAAPQSPIVEEADDESTNDQDTVVLEAVVGKKNVKIPIPTADTPQDDIVPDDESQFAHDEYKDSPVQQEAFIAVEKEEPSVVAEQPALVVATEEEPVVPDDQSEFVVAEKENIAVGGIPVEQSEEVPKKVKPNTSV